MQNFPQYNEISHYHNRVRHSSRSKVIYWSLLLSLCVFITALFFVTIDVNIQSRGILTTIDKQGEVYASTYGQIGQVFVKENDFVEQGDTLFTLNSTELHENWQLTQKRIRTLQDEIADLGYLTRFKRSENQKHEWQTDKYRQQERKFRSDQRVQKELIEKIGKEYQRQTGLFKAEVISESEHEKIKYDYENTQLVYEQMVNSQLSAWQTEMAQCTERLLQLKQSLVSLKKEQEKHVVLAPFSGHVQKLLPLKKGTVVFANQKICAVSPTDNLLVETYISPADIGFVAQQQKVMLRIDAFNSNRWGMAEGKVEEIASDITVEGSEVLGFRTLCKINNLKLHYKGRTAQLKKGMTLTANFVLTRRTLAQLLFDDVSDWLNPNNSNQLAENE